MTKLILNAPANPKRPKRVKAPLTNEQFLTECMNYSSQGGLIQAFILEALRFRSKQIAETPIDQVIDAFGEDHPINPRAWHACAVELHKKLEDRFNGEG